MPHPVFDEVIHEPHRLRICAYLVPVAGRDFGDVRDEMDLSDSALSKHLKALSARGYTRLERGVRDGRQVTTVILTTAAPLSLPGEDDAPRWDYLLVKPFTAPDLAKAMQQVLAKKQR